jgi:hypothetical protein
MASEARKESSDVPDWSAVKKAPSSCDGDAPARFLQRGAGASAVDTRAFQSLTSGGYRSTAETRRIAVHEAGHCVAGRALGNEIGGATIVAGPDYGGLTWGPLGGPEGLRGGLEKSILRDAISRTIALYTEARALTEELGESLSDGEGYYQIIRSRVIELLAGIEAERLLCIGDPIGSQGDQIQARAISKAFCLMGDYAVVDRFIDYCTAEARALIAAHRPAVLAVAEELIFKQTIDGAAIDVAIARALAKPDLDREKARRADWRAVIDRASGVSFEKLRG